jgi:hypothetical protein
MQANWQMAAGHVQFKEAGESCKARVLVNKRRSVQTGLQLAACVVE